MFFILERKHIVCEICFYSELFMKKAHTLQLWTHFQFLAKEWFFKAEITVHRIEHAYTFGRKVELKLLNVTFIYKYYILVLKY